MQAFIPKLMLHFEGTSLTAQNALGEVETGTISKLSLRALQVAKTAMRYY
jgi:hypothetical protein